MAQPPADPRQLIVDLCQQFYTLGWVSGTGGGVSVRRGDRIYMAPSGVQKERLKPADIFVLDLEGQVVSPPADPSLAVSECCPLFMNAYRLRGAGAVIHSHSLNVMLATLLYGEIFEVTHLEMMKGLRGVGFRDQLRVPIIENTDRESELAGAMSRTMARFPETPAVMVRRHGVYIWGPDWASAKTQAECLDYLCEAAVRMRQLGLDPSQPPR